MDIKQLFLYLSVFVGLITPIIGIRSIFKGEYKPQRITRLVIFLVTVLFVATLYFQGDRNGLYLAFVQSIGGIAIFILSFKYGVGGKSKLDIITLIGALISLAVWKLTDNPTLGLYASLLTDLIGFTPTLIKAFKEPYTEDSKFYASDVIASSFNLLALRSYLLMDLAFPIYMFIINLSITLIIILRRKYINKRKDQIK